MRHVIIDHSYHRKTLSSRWFVDFLKNHSNTLDVAWEEKWEGTPSVSIPGILAGNYDRIFVFQLERVAAALARHVPERLIFVPMYDSCYALKDRWWRSLGPTRILSLSWTLHSRLRRLGLRSVHAQYFPDPDLFKTIEDFSDLKGFFWLRRPNLSWPIVKQLSSNSRWSRFFLHDAPDPDPDDAEPERPSDKDIRDFNVSISRWREDSSHYDENVSAANVFFASRRREGIGLSFLEAMARGQCVIAPDAPSFSEYITSNVSGLLYDPDAPGALDLSRAAKLGAAARRRVELGYPRWATDLRDRLPEFLFNERSEIASRGADHGTWQLSYARPAVSGSDATSRARILSPHSVPGKAEPTRPPVTIAMVVRNATLSFADTFRSVASQTYPNFDIVVVDGYSTDGTQDLIRARQGEIWRWLSEPDASPYEGMNKAAHLAKGEWILFMNAGDSFYTYDAIERAFDRPSPQAEFIIGHHIYRTVGGVEALHKAQDFEQTWEALTSGNLNRAWAMGIPGHQATFTRTALLRSEGGYRWQTHPFAADHEFMYRTRSKGARFDHCDEIIATYVGGGTSWMRRKDTVWDWWRIARCYAPPVVADKFYLTPWQRIMLRHRDAVAAAGSTDCSSA